MYPPRAIYFALNTVPGGAYGDQDEDDVSKAAERAGEEREPANERGTSGAKKTCERRWGYVRGGNIPSRIGTGERIAGDLSPPSFPSAPEPLNRHGFTRGSAKTPLTIPRAVAESLQLRLIENYHRLMVKPRSRSCLPPDSGFLISRKPLPAFLPSKNIRFPNTPGRYSRSRRINSRWGAFHGHFPNTLNASRGLWPHPHPARQRSASRRCPGPSCGQSSQCP